MPFSNISLLNSFDVWRSNYNQIVHYLNELVFTTLVTDQSIVNIATANVVNTVHTLVIRANAHAQTAHVKAQTAWELANLASSNALAQTAYVTANTAWAKGQTAFETANTAWWRGQTAFIAANAGYNSIISVIATFNTHAQSAHVQANTAYWFLGGKQLSQANTFNNAIAYVDTNGLINIGSNIAFRTSNNTTVNTAYLYINNTNDLYYTKTGLTTKLATFNDIASQAEALAETSNIKLMTPITSAQQWVQKYQTYSGNTGAAIFESETETAVASALPSFIKSNVSTQINVGYYANSYNLGVVSSGVRYLDANVGGFQRIYITGSVDLRAPNVPTTMIVDIVNLSGSPNVNINSFRKITGDNVTTNVGHTFIAYVTKTFNNTAISILAMQ